MKKLLSILLSILLPLISYCDFEGLPLTSSNYTWASTRSVGVISQLWESVQERCLILSDRIAPLNIIENWTIQDGYTNDVVTYTWIGPDNLTTNKAITNKTPHYITITTTNQINDYSLILSNNSYADWFTPLSKTNFSATTNMTISFPVTYDFLSTLDNKIFEMTPHFVNTNLAWYGNFDLWFSLSVEIPFAGYQKTIPKTYFSSYPSPPYEVKEYTVNGVLHYGHPDRFVYPIGADYIFYDFLDVTFPTNYPFLNKAAVMEHANIGYRTNITYTPFLNISGGDAWFTRQPALTNTWILWQTTREKYDICVSNGPAKLNGNYIKVNPADYPWEISYSYYFGFLDPFYLREDGQAYIGRGYVDPSDWGALTTDGYTWEIGVTNLVINDFTDRYFSYQKLSTNIVFELWGYVRYDSISPKYSTNTWVKYDDISPWIGWLPPLIEPSVPGWPPAASSMCVFEGTNGYWLNRNIANYDRRYYSTDPKPYWKRIFPTGLSSNVLTNVVINIDAKGSKFDFSTPDSLGEQAVVPAEEYVEFTYSKTNIPSTNMWFRTFDTQSVVTGYAPIGTSIVLMWTNSHFYDKLPYRLYAENINERVKYIQQLVWTTHTNYQWYGEQDDEVPSSSRNSFTGHWSGTNYNNTYKDPTYYGDYPYSVSWIFGITVSGVYTGNILPDEATWQDYQDAPPYENAYRKFKLWDGFLWHWMDTPVPWQTNSAIRWTDKWNITASGFGPLAHQDIRPDLNITMVQYLDIQETITYRTPYGPYSTDWLMSLWKDGGPDPEAIYFASLWPFFWEIRGEEDNIGYPVHGNNLPTAIGEEWQSFVGEENKTTLILTNIPTRKNWGQGINHKVNYYSSTNISSIISPLRLSEVSTLNSNNNENVGKKEVSWGSITNMTKDGRAFGSNFRELTDTYYTSAWSNNYVPQVWAISNVTYQWPEYTDYVVVTNYAEVKLWSLDPNDPGENPDIYEGATNVYYPTNMYGYSDWEMYDWRQITEDRIRTYSNFTNQLITGYSTNGLVTNGMPRVSVPYPVGVDGWVELYTNVVQYSITNITPAEILKVRYVSYTGPSGSILDGTSPYPNTYLWTNSLIWYTSDLILTNYAVTNVHDYYQTNLSVKLVHWQREYLVKDCPISTANLKVWELSQEQKFTKHYYVYLRYLDPLMKWDLEDGLKRK